MHIRSLMNYQIKKKLSLKNEFKSAMNELQKICATLMTPAAYKIGEKV